MPTYQLNCQPYRFIGMRVLVSDPGGDYKLQLINQADQSALESPIIRANAQGIIDFNIDTQSTKAATFLANLIQSPTSPTLLPGNPASITPICYVSSLDTAGFIGQLTPEALDDAVDAYGKKQTWTPTQKKDFKQNLRQIGLMAFRMQQKAELSARNSVSATFDID